MKVFTSTKIGIFVSTMSQTQTIRCAKCRKPLLCEHGIHAYSCIRILSRHDKIVFQQEANPPGTTLRPMFEKVSGWKVVNEGLCLTTSDCRHPCKEVELLKGEGQFPSENCPLCVLQIMCREGRVSSRRTPSNVSLCLTLQLLLLVMPCHSSTSWRR